MLAATRNGLRRKARQQRGACRSLRAVHVSAACVRQRAEIKPSCQLSAPEVGQDNQNNREGDAKQRRSGGRLLTVNNDGFARLKIPTPNSNSVRPGVRANDAYIAAQLGTVVVRHACVPESTTTLDCRS